MACGARDNTENLPEKGRRAPISSCRTDTVCLDRHVAYMGGSTKKRPRSSCGPASSWHGDSINKIDTAAAPFLAAGPIAAVLLISTLIDLTSAPFTITNYEVNVPNAAPQIGASGGNDVVSNAIIATQTVPIGGAHIGITIAEQLVSMVPSVKELLLLFLQGDSRLFAELLPL